jgi:hypothetical protein
MVISSGFPSHVTPLARSTMSPTRPSTSRLPRAGVDPITDDATALALLRVAASPTRHETIVVLLDAARCGIGLVVVSDTSDPDAVVDVTARILDPAVHAGQVGAVILASVRPTDGVGRSRDDLSDAERWLDLDRVATARDVDLVEWFVLGAGVSRPRELVNAPPRW